MDKQLRFSRLEKVIGEDNVSLINNKCVLILGVGGVGGYVAEALARSNIGKLILVDFDVVDLDISGSYLPQNYYTSVFLQFQ